MTCFMQMQLSIAALDALFRVPVEQLLPPETPGDTMTEQQQWLADLCRMVGYTPCKMPFAGREITFTTSDGAEHSTAISTDGIYILGMSGARTWKVRVHDEQLPLSFRRAVETGKGDEMTAEQAKLSLLKLVGTGAE